MAISIRYPHQTPLVDASGLINSLADLGDLYQTRRADDKAADAYSAWVQASQAPQQQPMTLASLAPQGGVQRAPLEPPMDPASARVASAHAASGGTPPQGAIEAYIRHAAQKRGIDPEIAIKVAMSEGGVTDPTRQSDVVKNGVREQSYGPFQLYMNGGLGNEALAAGIDPRTDWKGGIDFALDRAKEGGWGPWYGAEKVGVTGMMGIGGQQQAQPQQMAQMAQPQGAPMGDSLLPPPDVMKALLRSPSFKPLAIDMMRTAQAARQGDPEAELRLRKLRAEINQLENPSSRDKFGNSVIWGQDETGKWVAMQPSSGGGLIPAPTPEGITLSPPGVGNLDLGTQYGIRDRSGNIINRVDKDLTGAEAAKVEGKDEGEARALYDSMVSKMPGLEQVVTRLDQLSGDATYTLAGRALDEGRRQLGMEPRDAAIARAEYTSIVDNQVLPLLRDTFGAQFTQAEGERLGRTLGDPDKSPAEKQALLRAFIEQKYRDIEALARRTGQEAPATGKRLRFNPATGELE